MVNTTALYQKMYGGKESFWNIRSNDLKAFNFHISPVDSVGILN